MKYHCQNCGKDMIEKEEDIAKDTILCPNCGYKNLKHTNKLHSSLKLDNKDLQEEIRGYKGFYIFHSDNLGVNYCKLDVQSDGHFRNTIHLFSIHDYPQREGLTIVPNRRLELGEVVALITKKVYDNPDLPNLSFTNQFKDFHNNDDKYLYQKEPKVLDKDHLDITANDFTFWQCRELENADIIDLTKYGLKDYYILGMKHRIEESFQ